MTAVCPSGHVSESEDYCDQCGARIGGSTDPTDVGGGTSGGDAAAAGGGTSAAAGAASESAPRAEPCPQCGASRSGDDRFCEGCGYDFVSGAPVGVAAWEAVTAADRDYFDRYAVEGLTFPSTYPERRFPLTGEAMRIGRGRSRPGEQVPEIDLASSPEDPGISHMHAVLRRQADGSYAVLDLGSTNGTLVNDDPAPIGAGVEVPLVDGDRIRVGAWTTITLHRVAS
jgi:hypothetical protein